MTMDHFINIDKKSDLEKYCRNYVINITEFAEFISNCELRKIPLLHCRANVEYVPNHLKPSSYILDIQNKEGDKSKKAFKKMSQLFEERRFLVVHAFFNNKKWFYIYFTLKDLKEGQNHWKHGEHVHFVSCLWPNYTFLKLWKDFSEGKIPNDSLHIRCEGFE